MPKKKRDQLKRTAGQAYRHLMNAQDMLGELWTMFNEVEPKYAEQLLLIGSSIEISKGGIQNFCTNAWGKFPEDIKTWTQ
jgi:hypothetical protein